MFCQNCGGEIDDNAQICTHCGVQTESIRIPGFSGFSKSCGIASHYEVTENIALQPLAIDAKICSLHKQGLPSFVLYGRNILNQGFEYSLQSSPSMWSWGEKVYISVRKSGSGSVLNIFSRCILPTQFIDYGRNKRNVKQLLQVLTAPSQNA